VLTSVTSSIGRTLTLAYNGSRQLTSVADNTTPARSVSYTYDSGGNLASFADPLGNTTTFAYTPAGGTSPANLLAQIFYPSSATPFVSNGYDTLGRVATQTNANGASWSYFFAGYRSEEDDAYGTRHSSTTTRAASRCSTSRTPTASTS
jgi:YD repeat-containing protein